LFDKYPDLIYNFISTNKGFGKRGKDEITLDIKNVITDINYWEKR